MKHDEGLMLIGDRVVLVPYRKEHVEKYHGWMGDPEILSATGSERLSLEEEFQMQQAWEQDEDKCTFIILSRELYAGVTTASGSEVKSMVGDVNLFLNVDKDDDKAAEIEIMIAEEKARRKGLASNALKLMMKFGTEKLKKTKYIAKIKAYNESSIKLFEKLGFKFQGESKVFNEITMVYETETSETGVLANNK